MDTKPESKLRTAVLSFQHMFAMLGATMLVPVLAGMSLSIALLSAGIGTILFYFLTQRKVPVFLGSSFAFLPALITIVGGGAYAIGSPEWSQRMACVMISLVLAGLVYVIFALIIKAVDEDMDQYFDDIDLGDFVTLYRATDFLREKA